MPVIKNTNFNWEGIDVKAYKDTPGSYMGVTRQELAMPTGAEFQTRYFEVAENGFTSHEFHCHEHVVVIIRGKGEVMLDGTAIGVEPFDLVVVESSQQHQFRNTGSEPFGFLCIVNSERDRPTLVQSGETKAD